MHVVYPFCVVPPRSPFSSYRLYRSKCLPLTPEIRRVHVRCELRCTVPGQRLNDAPRAMQLAAFNGRIATYPKLQTFSLRPALRHFVSYRWWNRRATFLRSSDFSFLFRRENVFAARNSKGKTQSRRVKQFQRDFAALFSQRSCIHGI